MATRRAAKTIHPPQAAKYVQPPVPCCEKTANRILNLVQARLTSALLRDRRFVIGELKELRTEIVEKLGLLTEAEP